MAVSFINRVIILLKVSLSKSTRKWSLVPIKEQIAIKNGHGDIYVTFDKFAYWQLASFLCC